MVTGSGTAGIRGGVVDRRPRRRTGFRARAAFGAGAGFGGRTGFGAGAGFGGRAGRRSRGGLGADTAFGAAAGDGRLAALGVDAERFAGGVGLAAGRLVCLLLVPDVVV